MVHRDCLFMVRSVAMRTMTKQKAPQIIPAGLFVLIAFSADVALFSDRKLLQNLI